MPGSHGSASNNNRQHLTTKEQTANTRRHTNVVVDRRNDKVLCTIRLRVQLQRPGIACQGGTRPATSIHAHTQRVAQIVQQQRLRGCTCRHSVRRLGRSPHHVFFVRVTKGELAFKRVDRFVFTAAGTPICTQPTQSNKPSKSASSLKLCHHATAGATLTRGTNDSRLARHSHTQVQRPDAPG